MSLNEHVEQALADQLPEQSTKKKAGKQASSKTPKGAVDKRIRLADEEEVRAQSGPGAMQLAKQQNLDTLQTKAGMVANVVEAAEKEATQLAKLQSTTYITTYSRVSNAHATVIAQNMDQLVQQSLSTLSRVRPELSGDDDELDLDFLGNEGEEFLNSLSQQQASIGTEGLLEGFS